MNEFRITSATEQEDRAIPSAMEVRNSLGIKKKEKENILILLITFS